MGQKLGVFKGVKPLTPIFRNMHLTKINPAYAPVQRKGSTVDLWSVFQFKRTSPVMRSTL